MTDPHLASILLNFEGRNRDSLLPLLWEVQTAFGHIGPEVIHAISHTLRVPEADIYGVVEFYSMFHTEPTGEKIIRVCTDPMCGLAGADALLHAAEQQAAHDENQLTVLYCTCLGLCDRAPAALISTRGGNEVSVGPVRDANQLLNGDTPQTQTFAHADPAVLLTDLSAQPTLATYGDYAALRHAIQHLAPEVVIAEVESAGLIGRGGAAFPTGNKWLFTRRSPAQPHYVVCNADESEPGTFKDRLLLEQNPHRLLEGIAICAYAVGASKAFLFVRGEYPEAIHILENAIAEATAAGLLGNNILGTGLSLEIEVRRGAGAYICGEETALFEAIEGKRGFPRMKPPFPTTDGLFNKPTTINNVETLCALPEVIQHGADWFKQWGTERSTGTKLVSVSGHVKRPGVYEIAPGISLRTLLEERCGGVEGTLKAVLMGGASGTFLSPEQIDVPLTFEDLRAIGSTFGSGAIMVFNADTDLCDVLQRIGRFFQHESCGKCFPCQLGTQRQMEILNRMGTPLAGDRQRLLDVGLTMTEASLCGLGQTAASAVLSAMKQWPELFNA